MKNIIEKFSAKPIKDRFCKYIIMFILLIVFYSLLKCIMFQGCTCFLRIVECISFQFKDFLMLLATLIVGFEASIIGHINKESAEKNNQINIDNTKAINQTELFLKFNEKYSELNPYLHELSKLKNLKQEDLDSIIITPIGMRQSTIDEILNSYIDLCCEETYCFQIKKQIDDKIWNSWHAGMMYWYCEIELLRNKWKDEDKVSYYTVDPFSCIKCPELNEIKIEEPK